MRYYCNVRDQSAEMINEGYRDFLLEVNDPNDVAPSAPPKFSSGDLIESTRPFDPPVAKTALEKRFDHCVKKLQRREPIDTDSKLTDPDVGDFLVAQKHLTIEVISAHPCYGTFLGLMAHPEGHTSEIARLVSQFRRMLRDNPRVGRVSFQNYNLNLYNVAHSSMTRFFPKEILTREDLSRAVPLLKRGGYWDDELKIIGANEVVSIPYLYHRTRKELVPQILKKGLMPTFLMADNMGMGNYVWSAYQEDSGWQNYLPKEMSLLRIRYDPSRIPAYYHFPGSFQDDLIVYDEPSRVIISCDLIPLGKLVGAQKRRDLNYIAREAHRRRDERAQSIAYVEEKDALGLNPYNVAENVDRIPIWRYVKFYNDWVPPEFYSMWDEEREWRLTQAWMGSTTNEVRLDYVGPEFIELIPNIDHDGNTF